MFLVLRLAPKSIYLEKRTDYFMEIIDAHIHAPATSGKDRSVRAFAKQHKIDFSGRGILREMRANNVRRAIALSSDTNFTFPTPIEKDNIIKLAKQKGFVCVAGINPYRISRKAIRSTEKLLANKTICGLKIYLGYAPFYPNDRKYAAFYRLARTYKVPVIFHTGDVFGSKNLVKFAHPLGIDEVAVAHPKVNFVIAHMGNPWIRDTAELLYKNPNVYADLSGIVLAGMKPSKILKNELAWAFDYVGNFRKFLYGSDWPLNRMKDYIHFMKSVVPRKHWRAVFYGNAKRLFKL